MLASGIGGFRVRFPLLDDAGAEKLPDPFVIKGGDLPQDLHRVRARGGGRPGF